MTEIGAALISLFRQAWGALTFALIAVAALAMLAQVLRLTAASALGASFWARDGIAAVGGIAFLALFTFWGIPAIITSSNFAIQHALHAHAGAPIMQPPAAQVTPEQEAGCRRQAEITAGLLASLNTPESIASMTENCIAGLRAVVSATNEIALAGMGPIVELEAVCLYLLSGLVALRILKAAFVSISAAAVGGSAPMAGALVEASEAILGMTLAAVALPIATHFFFLS